MSKFLGWWSKVPRKVKYFVWTLALYAVKTRWPDAPLPPPDQLMLGGGGLVGSHLLTDLAHTITSTLKGK